MDCADDLHDIDLQGQQLRNSGYFAFSEGLPHANNDPVLAFAPPTARNGGRGSEGKRSSWKGDDEDVLWAFLTARVLQMVKALLFTLWVVLSFSTVMYFHWFDNSPGSAINGLGRGEPVTGVLGDGPRSRGRIRAPPLPPLLRPASPRNHIPLPLPPNKVSVVLMNYSRPRMIQESTLMRTLLSHPNIDEVVILHANPNTAFKLVHPKVVNVDATQQNDQMGLSLRFYFCQLARNDWVIHVDDDIEFALGTLSQLLIEFGRNPHRIVGRFGRNMVEHNSFNGYSSKDTHKQSEVILTKFMIMERQSCSAFFDYAHLIWEDTVLNNGEGPLWNGEDIFMSLVSNHVYGRDGEKANYAMDWLEVWNAPDSLKDYDNGRLDISGGMTGFRLWDWHWWQSVLRRNRHYSYRGNLWKTGRRRLSDSGLFQSEE